MDGRWYRCHCWIDGSAKLNEATTIVTRLHQLAVPVTPPPTRSTPQFGRAHWHALTRRRSDATWATLIEDHLDDIVRAERSAAAPGDSPEIGSHRDLNAHNVLFTGDGLVLIDWDAAGPISIRYERALTATLWAQRDGGRLDLESGTAFLRSYRATGGVVEPDDVVELRRWLGALSWWTERNVQIAIAQPSHHHDALASNLVTALAQGEDNVRSRPRFLAEAIARVSSSA